MSKNKKKCKIVKNTLFMAFVSSGSIKNGSGMSFCFGLMYSIKPDLHRFPMIFHHFYHIRGAFTSEARSSNESILAPSQSLMCRKLAVPSTSPGVTACQTHQRNGVNSFVKVTSGKTLRQCATQAFSTKSEIKLKAHLTCAVQPIDR